MNSYNFEVYCHGWDHFGNEEKNVYEFQNSGYKRQLKHLQLARAGLERIGIKTRVFGAPFLRTDSDTSRALLDSGFQLFMIPVWKWEEDEQPKQIPIKLWFEDWKSKGPQKRGKPRPVDEIIEEFNKYDDSDCLVGHMHPNQWGHQIEDFNMLISYIAKKRQFLNPQEYYKLLKDSSHFRLKKLSETSYIFDLSKCYYEYFLRIREKGDQKVTIEQVEPVD